jgi:predicted transcriptional regulator
MPPKKQKIGRRLAPREQQIMDVVHQLGEASVADVRERLVEPPTYSSVRTMLGHLERKGLLKRDRSSVKHLYRPVQSQKAASLSALRAVVDAFFPKVPVEAVAALIDDSAETLTDVDFKRLEEAIRRARKERR